MSPPIIIAGGGTWGYSVDKDEVVRQVGDLKKQIGLSHIDTAAVYPFSHPHGSETIIGEAGFASAGIAIDTKVMWFDGGKGTLTKELIPKSVDESLARLNTDKVNVLYAIGPDHQTPLEEQAEAFDAVYRQGKFAKLGVCNFAPDMLEKFVNICNDHGYVKPSVYQGQYNLLCRTYEETLFPYLRKHNIAFMAFSPLAQGMLTGKLTLAQDQDRDLKGTRFDTAKDNMYGKGARSWYDHNPFHDAVRQMKAWCDEEGIDLTTASMRWIVNHSKLDGNKGDGIIIGPRNKSQCDTYIEGIKAGPLPPDLAAKIDSLWAGGVRELAPNILKY